MTKKWPFLIFFKMPYFLVNSILFHLIMKIGFFQITCSVIKQTNYWARSVMLKFAVFNPLWWWKNPQNIQKMTETIANIFYLKARRQMSNFCQNLCIENRSNVPCLLKRTLSMNMLKKEKNVRSEKEQVDWLNNRLNKD